MPQPCEKELVIDRLEREVEILVEFKKDFSSAILKLNGYVFVTMIAVIGYLVQQHFFNK